MKPNRNIGKQFGNLSVNQGRPSAWQILVEVYNEFATQSTIHGVKYTSQSKTVFGRCLWLFIVAISIIMAGWLANQFYRRHEMANMRTLVISNQYPSWKMEIPAVTFCHSDIASLHRYEETIVKTGRLNLSYNVDNNEMKNKLKFMSIGILPTNQYEREIYTLNRIMVRSKLEMAELFELVAPKCSDFIVMCLFEGKEENCENFVTRSYSPIGICCSFNYAYLYKERRWNATSQDYYSVSFGGRYIMSFLFKSYGPKDRLASVTYGDGIKVMIHEKNTYPGISSLEFIAATGQENVARLYGKHLSASPEVLAMKSEDRDCEVSSSSENLYRADNCFIKCREDEIFRFCGCLPFFSSTIRPDQKICNFTHVPCLTRIKQKAHSLTLRDKVCGCLPDCESTSFSLVTTSVPLNAPQFNPSKFYQKAKSIPNATAIHITYSDQSSMLMRRELVLSWINLVSSLGGVFSLFLGCSFISLFELIYFFGFRFIMKLRAARRAEVNFKTT